MGKSGRQKGAEMVTKKVRRNFSEYNASNYLIATSEGTTAGDSSSRERSLGDDCGSDHEGGGETLRDKHALYQRAVQSPKGDLSYLQKFFLNYIGGRTPLHLREDFCGTALICAEWVRGDSRRTAVGLDLDEEALCWGLQHNIWSAGSDAYSRVHLFCGDVVNPLSEAREIEADVTLHPHWTTKFSEQSLEDRNNENSDREVAESNNVEEAEEKAIASAQDLPGADMVCAFNYSCCCLQKRVDLVRYFRQALMIISDEGGIFAMDLYGGTSSECALKLHRKFENFKYTWEQEDFDITTRTTRISLHFRLNNNQGVLRHAFSYHWRLWTLPEVKECLMEAGFSSVHFWIKEMPDLQGRNIDEFVGLNAEFKYEEVDSFTQEDAWNAYVVAVAPPKVVVSGDSLR